MKFNIIDRVLHIIYNQKDIKSHELQNIREIARIYENTDISTFIGYNFPIKFVPSTSFLYKYNKHVDYIIVYKDGDVKMKEHELCHARFYMDKDYKESIYLLWNSIKHTSKQYILDMLLRMKYRNDIDILIDEFQAYYYTENPNFFGKIVSRR